MTESHEHIDRYIQVLSQQGDVILLESQKKDHPASVRSYIAAIPEQLIFGFGEKNCRITDKGKSEFEGNPWEFIKEFQSENKNWMFGYFGYELKNSIEQLDSKGEPLSSLPHYYFMQPKILIEFNVQGTHTFILGESDFEQLTKDTSAPRKELKVTPKNSINKRAYISKIETAKELIFEGDVYEVNYSYPKTYSFEGVGFELYQQMRKNGPVPFGAYLRILGKEVCCASPERFLKKSGEHVFSQPIKGTISNSNGTSLQDLKTEKNLAENLMIVDLVRNDLGRIAKKGSVNVDRLFEVQSFETVHHLVSTVECEVSDDVHSIDIIKACFPMGSMTGAPKISAMQIIDDLEEYQRGIYSGAIGYITPTGDFDLNVVIRTAIIEQGELHYPVGGAITSDSDPEEEWKETKVKTRALKKALNNFEINE